MQYLAKPKFWNYKAEVELKISAEVVCIGPSMVCLCEDLIR